VTIRTLMLPIPVAPPVAPVTPVAAGPDVPAFLGLVIAVAVVAAAVRVVRVPYTVALVLTGLALALAPGMPRFDLTPQVIFTVFLPVLLFHGSYNLDVADLRANLVPVATLAIPGVVATAGLVGAALHLLAGLSWGSALLFGAIVSATDPVAVLAIFGEVGAPRRLATIVNGESLFNDGTALVLFAAILGVITSGAFHAAETVERFAVAVAGSLALGAALAIVAGAALRRIDDALLETTITLILAYGGFLLADRLGVSGPLETVTAGLVLGARGRQVMSPTTRLQAQATWQFLDFLANSLLFLLVGLGLRTVGAAATGRLALGALLWPLVVAILATVVSRVAIAWCVAQALRAVGRPLPRGWRTVLTWAGLRGAVSLAAGLGVPGGVPDRGLLLALTFGVVLFTLLAQGLTIRAVMERLGLLGAEASRHDYEFALGELQATEAALRELATLRRADLVDADLGARLEREYGARRARVRARLADLSHGATPGREQEVEAMRRLLHVEREAVRGARARGLLSYATERALTDKVERDLARLEPALSEDA